MTLESVAGLIPKAYGMFQRPILNFLQGMNITKPHEGDKATAWVDIQGTYRMQIYKHIQLFTRIEHLYYPHGIVQFNKKPKTWSGKVQINMGTSNDAIVLVVECSDDALCLIDYFNHLKEAGKMTGIPIQKPPKGFNILDQVRLLK